jgi:choice-of-anchor C domain-containing protein
MARTRIMLFARGGLAGAATLVLLGGLSSVAPVSASAAKVKPPKSIVADGTFKTPTAPQGSFTERCVTPTPNCNAAKKEQKFGPWKVTSGSVDIVSHTFWQQPEGSTSATQSVDMNGEGPGTIEQKLKTVDGDTYVVSYELAANPDCGVAVKTMDVKVAGTVRQVAEFESSNSHADMGWVPKTFEFTATSTATALALESTSGTSCGAAVADITAVAK